MEINALNEVYKPLYDTAKKLNNLLKTSGYTSEWGWYAFHEVKVNQIFVTEFFPIPVITVNNICDIGIDINSIFIETKLYREQALSFDFKTIPFSFEAYGIEEYLKDFYTDGMEMDHINAAICESNENEVGISFTFDKDIHPEAIIEVIHYCQRIEAHILDRSV